MIETQLKGLFPPDFEASERINLSQLIRSGGGSRRPPTHPVSRIDDARRIQAEASSEQAFLAEHGFVLLNATTAVADWDDAAHVAQTYFPEVDRMIRTRLYPGKKVEIIQPPNVGRRGPGTSNPQYGLGVHQDHGTTADDFQHNVAAFTSLEMGARWRARFDRDDVDGYVMLDFWRTTGMAGPLKHMPLALCDPTSVEPPDIISTALEGIAPSGAATHHVGLRYNPAHRWFYYPDMTADEVLVFKLFQLMRDEHPQPYRACFHTAVDDPAAPANAQPRQSCEHRVSVLFLKA